MVVVPTASTLDVIEDLAVTLPRYAQIINMKECAFWGVDNPDDEQPGCDKIWTKHQRDTVARALQEAQEEIEQVTDFPLSPRWFASEHQVFRCPAFTDWGRVIEAGVEASSTISAGETVSHAADPAVVGPVVTTVTDEDEIRIFHPGSDNEIIPSDISISGGSVTISIPRCRMVKESLVDNPDEGLDYSDTTNFESTVDVKRIYNDPSTNATLVWPHTCDAQCSSQGCAEYTQTACIYISNAEIGMLDVVPAEWVAASETWDRQVQTCCAGTPSIVRLNYRAGMDPLTGQAEDAIVRLAHSKMPDETCACQTWGRLWKRDREVPRVLTAERLNCPFGINDGAWIAWRFANSFRLVRGGVL